MNTTREIRTTNNNQYHKKNLSVNDHTITQLSENVHI